MVISRLRQNVGSCRTNKKLSMPTKSIPSMPETRFHSVSDSSTTETSGTKVNSSTPSRLGAMNNQPTSGLGSEGALPAARGRAGPVPGPGGRAAVVRVVISVLPEAFDECIGIGVDRVDRTGGGALEQPRSEEHTSELQSRFDLVCRLLLEKKKKKT